LGESLATAAALRGLADERCGPFIVCAVSASGFREGRDAAHCNVKRRGETRTAFPSKALSI
jgi:hypothetical protein